MKRAVIDADFRVVAPGVRIAWGQFAWWLLLVCGAAAAVAQEAEPAARAGIVLGAALIAPIVRFYAWLARGFPEPELEPLGKSTQLEFRRSDRADWFGPEAER